MAAGLDSAGLGGGVGAGRGGVWGRGAHKEGLWFQGCKADLWGWCSGIFKKGVEEAGEAPFSWTVYESWCLSRALGAV